MCSVQVGEKKKKAKQNQKDGRSGGDERDMRGEREGNEDARKTE